MAGDRGILIQGIVRVAVGRQQRELESLFFMRDAVAHRESIVEVESARELEALP